MKKIVSILMITILSVMLVACTASNSVPDENSTVGEHLLYEFRENSDKTPQEIADILLANPVIQFMSATMPVEPGLLNGFDNYEVSGFTEGVMFGPAMGTIPFVGYIFELDEDTDVDEFKDALSENANLRWNICTEADEMIVENEGNLVFFLMCPKSFDEPTIGEGAVDDDAFTSDEIIDQEGITLE